ncbi:MAG: omptin family outer membrane protease [Thermodesulfobacteriota bacterium]|nr:omptin family outer membrane protease [Thermodesulfobacteriota bacterium]
MRQKTTSLITGMLIILLALPAMAGDWIDADFAIGVDRIHGETAYRIGGTYQTPGGTANTNNPLSELCFPLEIFMASAQADIVVADRVAILLSARTGLTDETRDMQDSDWTSSAYPSWRTIYSESRTDMDATELSGRLRYNLYTTHLTGIAVHTREQYNLSFWAGLGYLNEEFEFTASDTLQFSQDSGFSSGFFPGPTLTYDITYTIPYLEFAATLNVDNKTDLNFSVGYSPYAEAEDEDNHLQRNRVSKAECEGEATLLSLDTRFALTKHWFTGFSVDYRYIEADGPSVTLVNGAWNNTINEEIESEQSIFSVNIGCRF